MIGISHSVKMALESLKSSKLRSALTMLGIIIGIAAVISTFTLGTSFSSYVSDQVLSSDSNYIMIFSMQENLFHDQQVDIIRNSRSVSGAAPLLTGSAMITYMGEQRNVSVYGVTEDYAQIAAIPIYEGSFISDKDTAAVVVGKSIAEDRFGKEISLRGTINISIWNADSKSYVTHTFRVKGISGTDDFSFSGSGGGNNEIYIPLSAMKEMTGKNDYSLIFAMADSPETVEEATEDIKRNLARNLGISERNLDDDGLLPFMVMNQGSLLGAIGSVINTITLFLMAIGGISLLVGSIGIMNIMIVTVVERTNEIGTLKALGYTSKDVLSVFLIESVVISGIGGTAGTIIGITVAYVASKFLGFSMSLPVSAVIGGIALSMAIGVVAGVYPARRAAAMNPVDALRAI